MAEQKKKKTAETTERKVSAKQAPIGTGMAKQAKETIIGRRRRLDDLIDEAETGKKN